MVRNLDTNPAQTRYEATISANRESLSVAIVHGERGKRVEQSALEHSTALTAASMQQLPLSDTLKSPVTTVLQAGLARSARHGMKEGSPALFIQVPFDEEAGTAVDKLQQLTKLWNNEHSTLVLTLPAVLTGKPQVIIQCARQLFLNEGAHGRYLSPSDQPDAFNPAGSKLLNLLQRKPGVGAVEFEEATFGLTNILVHPQHTEQLEHLLVSACCATFHHFGFTLVFAS